MKPLINFKSQFSGEPVKTPHTYKYLKKGPFTLSLESLDSIEGKNNESSKLNSITASAPFNHSDFGTISNKVKKDRNIKQKIKNEKNYEIKVNQVNQLTSAKKTWKKESPIFNDNQNMSDYYSTTVEDVNRTPVKDSSIKNGLFSDKFLIKQISFNNINPKTMNNSIYQRRLLNKNIKNTKNWIIDKEMISKIIILQSNIRKFLAKNKRSLMLVNIFKAEGGLINLKKYIKNFLLINGTYAKFLRNISSISMNSKKYYVTIDQYKLLLELKNKGIYDMEQLKKYIVWLFGSSKH